MAAADPISDVLIVGAGPAGLAAAIRARQLGLSAIVIERMAQPAERLCAGWTGPLGTALCDALEVRPQAGAAQPFSGLVLHTWDLTRKAEINHETLSGWVVQRPALEAALEKSARRLGALVERGCAVERIRFGESDVVAQLADGRSVVARVAILADGSASRLGEPAGLLGAARLAGALDGLFIEYPVSKKSAPAELHVFLGGNRDGRQATLTRSATGVRLCLSIRQPSSDGAAQLERFIESLTAAKLTPGTLPARRAAVRLAAGAALELEAHVGKRCLLVGDAGGFSAAFSQEGIYPAMKSGCIAAETVHSALATRQIQDGLALFDANWRLALADYLRMPNTDLALLPLLFGNPRISERVARAFLLGESF